MKTQTLPDERDYYGLNKNPNYTTSREPDVDVDREREIVERLKQVPPNRALTPDEQDDVDFYVRIQLQKVRNKISP